MFTITKPVDLRKTRRQLLQAAGLAAAALAIAPLARAADEPGKKVLFFTKSAGFEHSVIKRKSPDKLAYAEQLLTDWGAKNGFDVTCSKDGTIFTPEKIKEFDAFIFYTTAILTEVGTDKQPAMTPAGKEALLQAIHDGKGFVGIHAAIDTFFSPGWEKGQMYRATEMSKVDPYLQMLGGEFIMHGEQQKSTLHVIDPKFPGAPTEDLTFVEEWYSLKSFPSDLHVILVQETAGMKGNMYARKPYPETWARKHGKGRVFYTSMGHREDVWKNPAFEKLVLGGIHWSLGVVDADVTPNYQQVTPDADVPMKK